LRVFVVVVLDGIVIVVAPEVGGDGLGEAVAELGVSAGECACSVMALLVFRVFVVFCKVVDGAGASFAQGAGHTGAAVSEAPAEGG